MSLICGKEMSLEYVTSGHRLSRSLLSSPVGRKHGSRPNSRQTGDTPSETPFRTREEEGSVLPRDGVVNRSRGDA